MDEINTPPASRRVYTVDSAGDYRFQCKWVSHDETIGIIDANGILLNHWEAYRDHEDWLEIIPPRRPDSPKINYPLRVEVTD